MEIFGLPTNKIMKDISKSQVFGRRHNTQAAVQKDEMTVRDDFAIEMDDRVPDLHSTDTLLKK